MQEATKRISRHCTGSRVIIKMHWEEMAKFREIFNQDFGLKMLHQYVPHLWREQCYKFSKLNRNMIDLNKRLLYHCCYICNKC